MLHRFTLVDLGIFALTLLLSLAIGLWHALKGRNSLNNNEFLLGGKQMPLVPMALSLLSSVVSGISLLSYPAEIYTMGTTFCWSAIGITLALLCTGIFIVPVIYQVDSVSVYQYLEERFESRLLRSYAALLFTCQSLLYMAVVLYAPSVALAGVTEIPIWLLIVSVGVACTIYTSIGGLKAVVWTDTFQAIVMYAGCITLVVMGTAAVGSPAKVLSIAANRSRLDGLTNVDPNPFQYMTVWTALFGGFFYWFTSFGSSQISLQRYCSMSTVNRAQALTWLTIPLMWVVCFLVFANGLVMFAYYADCDPLKSERIKSRDQLVIFFMTDVFRDFSGLPGVFLACLFSGTLSTVSSGINSLSAVTWAEVVQPWSSGTNEKTATLITRIIGSIYGVFAIVLAFAAEPLGGIFKAVVSGIGALGGPVLGLILLGSMTTWGNWKGGLIGTFCGSAMALWVFIGQNIYRPRMTRLSTSVAACAVAVNKSIIETLEGNTTELIQPESLFPNATKDKTALEHFYSLSFFMFALLGATTTFAVGATVSYFTGGSEVSEKKPELVFWTKNLAQLQRRYSTRRSQDGRGRLIESEK